MKHVRDAASRGEVAVVLRENSPDFRSRPVSIVRSRLYDDRHTAGRITFVRDFVELLAILCLAGAALDRPLDIVIGHALRSRRKNSAPQTGIGTRIAAAALRRDGDFLG